MNFSITPADIEAFLTQTNRITLPHEGHYHFMAQPEALFATF